MGENYWVESYERDDFEEDKGGVVGYIQTELSS